MEAVRAVYIVTEDSEYAKWMHKFWAGECEVNDPLYELIHPQDLRGEATAWSDTPHWTILDALTSHHPDDFDDIVRSICKITEHLIIEPREIDMWGNGLMLKCDSPDSAKLRDALAASTRNFISRSPLSDEEFQHAEWWIGKINGSDSNNITLLRDMRTFYMESGSPQLPSSRHFRIGTLVRLYKGYRKAEASQNPETIANAKAQLGYFMDYGEPNWYHQPYKSHSTIASGIHVTNEERKTLLERYRKLIQPKVIEGLGKIYNPDYIAILSEDPKQMIKVHFFDWLTETFVEETRPKLKIIERVSLASR